ncbi:MAG TPA: hypothetical protein VK922_13030 [Gemmatimonadaceae bacterium]|nr:hypothetical protein [Gemmatimonadaceae bacterium]
MTPPPQVRRAPWTRLAFAILAVATVTATIAARPAPSSGSGVSIIAAKYTRLADSKLGPTITAAVPVLEMPRGYTYRVTVVGHGIDLVQTIVPGNSSVLSISNVRRRNGLETRGPGELLFDIAVSRQSTAYQRIPVNFRYVTGQTDRLYIEVHPGGRITSMTPLQVPANQPVTVTYQGIDLSTFVLSGGDFVMQRIVERTPTRVRIEYVFPTAGPTARYVILGSKQTGRDEIFAFAGVRPLSITGAEPKVPPTIPRTRLPTTCRPTTGNPCP